MISDVLRRAILAALVLCGLALPAIAQEPDLTTLVDAFKANMADSQAVLQKYEWIETTVVNLDGIENPPRKKLCYYKANGDLRKDPLPVSGKRFARDMIPPDEMEGLTKYVQDAMKLMYQYIPLNLSGIQSAQLGGNLFFKVTEPGKRALLTISNFLLPGDRMVLDLDLATKRPLSLSIDSYLDNQKNPVTLRVNYGSLYGTASFPRQTVLEAKGRDLKVTIQNTEYIKIVP